MAIAATDVKLLKSQRMTDETDGGGRATGVVVVDGEVNNVFPDISRLGRTVGRTNLRKLYAGVTADNADPFLGAHAIVIQPPADPRVSVLLFDTRSQTDQRAAAAAAVENYVVPSVTAQFELLGNQLAGQRAITGVQREEGRVPEVGEVYQLVNGSASQYVRLTSVDEVVENFIYEYGGGNIVTLPRRRLTLGTSAPLASAFPGGSVTPAGTSATNLAGQAKSLVLTTQVADAARYYSISPLAAAISQGDLNLQVQSIYSQLVPSATKETALLDRLAGYNRRQFAVAGPARTVSCVVVLVTSGQYRTFIGHGVLPGSVRLTFGASVYVDRGDGVLLHSSGSAFASTIEVDYVTGEINIYATGISGTASVQCQPAAAVTGPAVTGEINISLANRGFAYTLALADAKPRPGTLVISYMALGKWYDISDPGSGELHGQGSGSVSFASGSVSFTLRALPDVDSAIIFSYVADNPAEFTSHSGTSAATARVRYQLPHDGINPGSLTATYTAGGVEKTITDSAAGSLAGDASGTIIYATGYLDMELAATPDAGTAIAYSYQHGSISSETQTPVANLAGTVSGTIAGAPLQPGCVVAQWQVIKRRSIPNVDQQVTYEDTVIEERQARDDGAGGWDGFYGSIDYSTGNYTLQVEGEYAFREYTYSYE